MSADVPLDEPQGWLLLMIAKGRGHEVSVSRSKKGSARTGHMLEAMEQASLISVRHAPEGWRCAILHRGRIALREWKAQMVEEATERLKVMR